MDKENKLSLRDYIDTLGHFVLMTMRSFNYGILLGIVMDYVFGLVFLAFIFNIYQVFPQAALVLFWFSLSTWFVIEYDNRVNGQNTQDDF